MSIVNNCVIGFMLLFGLTACGSITQTYIVNEYGVYNECNPYYYKCLDAKYIKDDHCGWNMCWMRRDVPLQFCCSGTKEHRICKKFERVRELECTLDGHHYISDDPIKYCKTYLDNYQKDDPVIMLQHNAMELTCEQFLATKMIDKNSSLNVYDADM